MKLVIIFLDQIVLNKMFGVVVAHRIANSEENTRIFCGEHEVESH